MYTTLRGAGCSGRQQRGPVLVLFLVVKTRRWDPREHFLASRIVSKLWSPLLSIIKAVKHFTEYSVNEDKNHKENLVIVLK